MPLYAITKIVRYFSSLTLSIGCIEIPRLPRNSMTSGTLLTLLNQNMKPLETRVLCKYILVIPIPYPIVNQISRPRYSWSVGQWVRPFPFLSPFFSNEHRNSIVWLMNWFKEPLGSVKVFHAANIFLSSFSTLVYCHLMDDFGIVSRRAWTKKTSKIG